MEYKIKALSIYEYGQRKDKNSRPHQEDWLYPSIGSTDDSRNRLFILCDGMGGHSAGEVASSTVCEAMSSAIVSALNSGESFTESLLLKAIDEAYNSLDRKDNSDDKRKKMGTTMTFLMLHSGGYTIAHIGDSRVYHVRPDKGTKEDIVFRTEDHSLVNDLLKIGELTPEEAETYPHRNVITRAMQPHLDYRHKADIYSSDDIRPGDYFFMCSDGMLEQMTDDNLCFNLNEDMDDESKIARLIRLTRDNKDNHSAHLIHILDVQLQPETSGGAGPEVSDSDASQPSSSPMKSQDAGNGNNVKPEAGTAKKRWRSFFIPCIAAFGVVACCVYMYNISGKGGNELKKSNDSTAVSEQPLDSGGTVRNKTTGNQTEDSSPTGSSATASSATDSTSVKAQPSYGPSGSASASNDTGRVNGQASRDTKNIQQAIDAKAAQQKDSATVSVESFIQEASSRR